MAGIGRDRMGKESEESRGSGLQAVPLIKKFSGPLMGLARENHQGERPGCALPISEWGWAGLLGWTEGSLPHPPLRPVPCQQTLRPWPSVSLHCTRGACRNVLQYMVAQKGKDLADHVTYG